MSYVVFVNSAGEGVLGSILPYSSPIVNLEASVSKKLDWESRLWLYVRDQPAHLSRYHHTQPAGTTSSGPSSLR